MTKPLDFDKLRLTLARAMEHLQLKKENRQLKETLAGRFERHNIIGNSRGVTEMLDTVERVAPTEATVLITGESGHGKRIDRRRHSF